MLARLPIGTLTVLAVAAALPALARAIVGGEPASGSYPWMVSVQFNGGHGCGGTVVRPRWVLTAAHCLVNAQVSKVSVVVGRMRKSDKAAGTRIKAEKLHWHPRWAGEGPGYDVGLIELAADAPAPPIAMVRPGQEAEWAPGTPATLLGWGLTETQSGSDELRQLTIPMVSDADCEREYGALGIDLETEVCAGDLVAVRSPCNGDSGGPLFVAGADGQPLQVGVISRGLECGRVPTYSVYGRIGGPVLSAWLDARMNADAPAPAGGPLGSPPPSEGAIRFRRGCRGTRTLTARVTLPAGTRPTRATLAFGRRTVRRWSRTVPTRLSAKRAPRRAFVARATVRLSDGRTLSATRRYPRCG